MSAGGYYVVWWVPKKGMKNFFDDCLKAWGHPRWWDKAVRDAICDRAKVFKEED